MYQAALLRITRNTRLWRKGQRVWVVYLTGALAALCLGRFCGKGRWIQGWVHWADKDGRGFHSRPDARIIGNVEISQEFYEFLCRKMQIDELETWWVGTEPGTTNARLAGDTATCRTPCGSG